MVNKGNPWLGLKSYDENDRLYGRDEETEELTNIIINSFFTTIYGKSGIGKTSLLKAGVFPVLKYEDFYPIYIRLEHNVNHGNSENNYLSQILNSIRASIASINSIPRCIDKEVQSLADVFEWYQLTTLRGIELTPVYVFDQFEEIFTQYEYRNKEKVEEFFKNISDILNNDTIDRNYRVVFCIREDYLYCIERFSDTIPAFKRNRYGLQDLLWEEALEVITIPQPNLVNTIVAETILHKLSSDNSREVNATILSLYLSQLYDKMVDSGELSVTAEIVHQFGDDVISSFYYDNIKGVSENSIAYLEEHLVTVGGYRHNIPLEDAISAGISQKEIEDLIAKRLICVLPRHSNVLYIEFSHDVLCSVVMGHRNERLLRMNSIRLKRYVIRGVIVAISTIFVVLIVLLIVAVLRDNREKTEQVNMERAKNDSIQLLNHRLLAQKDSMQVLNLYLLENADSIQRLNKNLSFQNDLNMSLLDSMKKQYHKLQLTNLALSTQIIKSDSLDEALKRSKETPLEAEVALQTSALKEKNREISELTQLLVKQCSVEGVMAICEDIRHAAETNNLLELGKFGKQLDIMKTRTTKIWGGIRSKSGDGDWPQGINNHFIYEPLFIEKYIEDKDIMKMAQCYSSEGQNRRGVSGLSEVFIRNCVIKKQTKNSWVYRATGHNELAIVAEPFGLLVMDVFDTTNQLLFKSSANVEKGAPSGFIVFDIPEGKNATIEVIITNPTDHDVSFVLISN